MGAVCDVYDALTSNRCYKNGWEPADTIRKMAEWKNGHFDERVFQAFVKTIGIYPSGTAPIPGVTGKLVVNAVLDAHPATRLAWMPRRADLIDYVARELRDGDVCISMGCGDVGTLPEEVLARRAARRVS